MRNDLVKKGLVFGIILLFVGAGITPSLTTIVSADNTTYTFYSTDDSEIVNGMPDDNRGSGDSMGVRNRYGGSGTDHWEADILIKFDVSSIPPNSIVTSATLYLYYWLDNEGNAAGRNPTIYRFLGDWSESTVTYNNHPATASQPSGYTSIPSSDGQWVTWDVTSDVQAFVNEEMPNYGWKIMDEEYWGACNIPLMKFRSKEYGNYSPYLEVQTYIENQPPEWRNQGQNKSIIQLGENISLYSQGKDDVALDWAWLATNESGEWLNYTSNWWNTNWAHRKKITIDHNKVDAALTNFPILISTTSLDFVSHTQPDGDDFVFISSDNLMKYNHEIESYNSTNGELIAWVNITSLSQAADTFLWVYYGNTNCSNQENVGGVWDPNFGCVGHMSDTSSMTISDSTFNGNIGTKKGIGEPNEVDGQIGKAQEWDDVPDDYISFPDDDSMELGTGDGTYEWWIKTNYSPSDVFYYLHSHQVVYCKTNLGSRDHHFRAFIQSADNTDSKREGQTNITDNAWHYIVLTVDNSQHGQIDDLRIFIDGSEDSYVGTYENHIWSGQTLSNTAAKYLGAGSTGTSCWNGLIDEFRISQCERSDAWISTSYNTMSSPETFAIFGNEQSKSGGESYGAPMKMDENDIWQWSNFTWQNLSISAGTTVDWRIYYRDTSGNVNCTDIMSFRINQPPEADADGPYTGVECSEIIFNASGSTDPDGDSLQYRWDFDSDGTWDTAYSTYPTAPHTWYDDYTGTVTVEVYDDVDTDTDTATVTVSNVAPTITSLNLTLDPVPIGTTVNLTGTFTDPGWLDTHTAAIDWDDGNTSAGDLTGSNGSYNVTDSWAYAQAGVYTITLTVTDDDGGSDTEIFQYVVAYNSADGFVTGGGWIDSPEGAYTPNPNLTGKANFGFVSKYKKGQQQPTGNTEFNFKVADLSFHSSSYDWLVIAGAKAMYKGTGTINNAGNYGFMLSAIDEELTPSTDVDLFRIKIWDKDNNDEVIYDNMLGEDDDADPTTEIGGGNIKIHTG